MKLIFALLTNIFLHHRMLYLSVQSKVIRQPLCNAVFVGNQQWRDQPFTRVMAAWKNALHGLQKNQLKFNHFNHWHFSELNFAPLIP